MDKRRKIESGSGKGRPQFGKPYRADDRAPRTGGRELRKDDARPTGEDRPEKSFAPRTRFGASSSSSRNTESREDRPKFGKREDRPQYGSREDRPKFGSRDERPQYGNREDRPKFGKRDERPQYGSRDERPKFGSRDERPKYGSREDRPQYGSREDRPKFGARSTDARSEPRGERREEREDRPQYGGNSERPRTRFGSAKPWENRRDARPVRAEKEEAQPESKARVGKSRVEKTKPTRQTWSEKRKPKPQTTEPISNEPMRLNRFIAHAGVCSRRRADEMILEGLVKINDVVIWERGTMVAPRDKVSVNGKIITPEDKIYILLNKPDDVITTASDEKGRKTVLDLIDLPVYEQARIYPVGRLDRHTQGVLLLTNDGEMANRLMHPRYEVEKYYLVYTTEPVSPDQLKLLKKGVMLEEGIAKMDMVDYISTKQNELGVMLHEGKNRQIRRMLEVIGHEVSYLERVNYAGLDLKGIRRGKWRRLSYSEIRHLKALVKLK